MLELTSDVRGEFAIRIVRGTKEECWLWTAGVHKKTGYGKFYYKGKTHLAHRVAYLIEHETIDPDLVIMHTCDNKWCVNPAHLVQGTQLENIHDSINKGRQVHPNGSDHGRSKLVESQIKAIKERYTAGETAEELASEYGVHKRQIFKILSNDRWKHL